MHSFSISPLQTDKFSLHRSRLKLWEALLVGLILFLFVCAARLSAQTAQWVKQMGTSGISNGVSSDAAGNAYATGAVGSPGLFDDVVIPCNVSDVFLARYDTAGGLVWAKCGGGDLLDQGNDVATDPAGNSYVVGSIQTNSLHPTAQFDNITLTGHGDFDWLVVKYDPAGNVLWAKNAGGTGADFAQGVALDQSGNVYVTGFYTGTVTVDGVTLTSRGIFDIFLGKYDANGTLLWIKSAGGTGSDQAHGVAVDAQGNIGVTGEFQSTATFGSRSIKAAGLGDAFIAKYDAAGNNIWVHGGGSTTSFAGDPAKAIAVDGASNFYITGDYTGTATFDGLSVPNTGTNGTDIFVAKYNANGAIQWLHHAGGPASDKGYSIGADLAGNSWVTGFAGSGPGVVFDSITLPSFGNEYIFLAKYDPAGAVQYVKQYAAGSGQDIHVLNNGCLYLNGGASQGAGNEFDNISLLFRDRGGFICQFCETVVPDCAPPTNLTASNITSSSAMISWSAVEGAAGYTLQYRKTGTSRWKTKQSNRPSVKLTKLMPSTSYDYQVATLCDTSSSEDPLVQVFTTAP